MLFKIKGSIKFQLVYFFLCIWRRTNSNIISKFGY